jgi:hypothetical protein
MGVSTVNADSLSYFTLSSLIESKGLGLSLNKDLSGFKNLKGLALKLTNCFEERKSRG